MKSVKKSGMGGNGVRESNGKGWMDQSKVYAQCTYIETPLWTSS
jgi:hypothetical protein